MKQVEITIGQKIKFQGKHGICAKYKIGDCNKCILRGTPLCCTGLVPCEDNNRFDKTSVYFPEVKVQQPPWNSIGEEAVQCPDQNGDNEWCNKESPQCNKSRLS